MISAGKELKKAVKERYAIGHFNIFNLETFQAVVNASNRTKMPVFMGTSNKTLDYAGVSNILGLYNSLPKTSKVILHLDHGSYENAKKCIRLGYPSVMFDGSSMPLNKNIKLTKKLVSMGNKKGVFVEGEVGILSADGLTNPSDAKVFVEKTGVDSLAVSIGNQHGYYKYMPVLDFQRLMDIRKVVNVPIVLHGASGLIESDIKTAIMYGVAKINIDTELRWNFTNSVSSYLSEHAPSKLNKDSFDARNYLGIARSSVEGKVFDFIRLFQR
ncbi:Fructose-bisphosphate aldolase class 2 [Candidatus Tiddalikarchaeum anstoanum]|nr:Fructose-bisphosphate aldolase class 2 [Candidatus Tiddalikarchaeum anstoanum]